MNVRLVIPLALLAACGPAEEQLRKEFLDTHPTAVIVQAGVGEGDFDNALWCVRYRHPPDTVVLEQVWLVQKDSNREWSVTSRDSAMAQDRICARAT